MSRDAGDDERTRPADAPSVDEGHAALLVFWDGGYRRLPLVGSARFELGRAEDCDVRVDHASVSRHHLRLHATDTLAIEDLGSFNGSRINGVALVPNVPEAFGPGDVVEMGSAVLVVQPGTRSAPTPEKPAQGAMQRLERLTDLVAQSRINVLLTGETGAGKEVTATEVHRRSPRASARFVSINCAAVPEALLEAELFGFERGAFTGADRAKPGLLESADGGTFFLDEVADLPLVTQAKLLRVLERREVQRLGALVPKTVDLRFIAATNRDLEEEVREKRFREDLYFRLNGITLRVPPLRERTFQIAELARLFVEAEAKELGRAPPPILPEAMRMLENNPWPGNVRELKNVMERAVLLGESQPISPEHIQLEGAPSTPASLGRNALRRDYESFERQRISEALERAGGNQTAAAKALGISRRTLLNRLDALGLPRPRKRG